MIQCKCAFYWFSLRLYPLDIAANNLQENCLNLKANKCQIYWQSIPGSECDYYRYAIRGKTTQC